MFYYVNVQASHAKLAQEMKLDVELVIGAERLKHVEAPVENTESAKQGNWSYHCTLKLLCNWLYDMIFK